MSDASALPKVSCLLVTADRPHLCRRAIRSYERQTYPNKELIVLDNGRERIEDLLDHLDEDVTYLHVDRKEDTYIGGLRNMSLDYATGEFVVPQWDDDDWSHPLRLERQARKLMEGYDACTLAGTLMHVDDPRYFEHPFLGLLDGGVPPTIMHRRDVDIRYPDLRRTSDSAYTRAWRDRSYTELPPEESHLYVRYFHGGNLWEMDHFLRRMRNTPADLIAFGWYKYVRRDLYSHPRFRLSSDATASFAKYLDDSYAVSLF